MTEEHTIKVTFEKDFSHRQFDGPADFVENCLSGNRASNFARGRINTEIIESDSEDGT